jgi:hypothetical protein
MRQDNIIIGKRMKKNETNAPLANRKSQEELPYE